MSDPQTFLRLMNKEGVLRFGDFSLRSGKKSPYFFNLGNVSSGNGLAELGRAFAQCISDHNLEPEILYGPAYKGIPFVVATAIALAERGIKVGIAFNRKEAKGYGEGGWFIGSAMDEKRVVLIDDVVFDGATKVESAEMIRNEGGILSAIVLGIDRMEYINANRTATESLQEKLQVQVHAVSDIHDVLSFLKAEESEGDRYRIVLDYAAQNCKLTT